MTVTRMPRRRFLQSCCVLPGVARLRPSFDPPSHLQAATPQAVDLVVEHRGWIVRASDRVRLESGALQ